MRGVSVCASVNVCRFTRKEFSLCVALASGHSHYTSSRQSYRRSHSVCTSFHSFRWFHSVRRFCVICSAINLFVFYFVRPEREFRGVCVRFILYNGSVLVCACVCVCVEFIGKIRKMPLATRTCFHSWRYCCCCHSIVNSKHSNDFAYSIEIRRRHHIIEWPCVDWVMEWHKPRRKKKRRTKRTIRKP